MIAWLEKAFGFTKHVAYENDKGGIMHAEMSFGSGIVMFGDSTTALRPGAVQKVYAQRVGEALQGIGSSLGVHNAGIGGNTTKNAMPDVLIEATALFNDTQKGLGILNHRRNFQFVANDPCISQQRGHFGITVFCNLQRLKIIKRRPITLPLFQDR